jgi:hypothetical protein
MIVRDVNVDDLSKFDFFNDAKDTIAYLRSVGRIQDADKLLVQNKHADVARWKRLGLMDRERTSNTRKAKAAVEGIGCFLICTAISLLMWWAGICLLFWLAGYLAGSFQHG